MEQFYPYATQQLLSPEATKPYGQGGEPTIIPRQVIFHTHGFAGSSESVGRYFGKDSIHVEAHASTKLDGRLIQFQSFDRQADAQSWANGFTLPNMPGKLFGAISLEHEEDASHRFSHAQIITDGLFLAWCSVHLGIPLQILRGQSDAGIGWHKQFAANNPNHHSCPYDGQVAQIREIINVANWFLLQSRPTNSDWVGRLKVGDSEWALQRDGGVITLAGDKFYGSYPGLPAEKRLGDRYFTQILSRGDGHPGYVLVSNRGEFYVFPDVG